MRLFNKRADCASGASGPGPGAVTPGEEGPGRPRGRGLAPRPGSPPLPRVCPAVTRVRVRATRPGTGRREGLDPLAQCPRPQPCTPLSGSLAQVPCAGEEAPGCDEGDLGVPSVGPPPASFVSQGAVCGGRAPPGRAATPHKAALLGAARAPATLGALRIPRPLSPCVFRPFCLAQDREDPSLGPVFSSRVGKGPSARKGACVSPQWPGPRRLGPVPGGVRGAPGQLRARGGAWVSIPAPPAPRGCSGGRRQRWGPGEAREDMATGPPSPGGGAGGAGGVLS